MFEIDIKRDFSAAHKLNGYNGNCASLHGHNWTVQVTLQSETLDEIGIAVDFRKLKARLDDVLAELDHSNLNEHPLFSHCNPTSEYLAKLIFDKLAGEMNDNRIKVVKVRVCESPDVGATYYKSRA